MDEPTTSRVYIGFRADGEAVVKVREKPSDELLVDLDLRLDLANHSPTGFEWGYHGSGPAQTALALLADATGDDVYARAFHQLFKAEIVAAWAQERSWAFTQGQIKEWAAVHPLSEADRFRWLPLQEQMRQIDKEAVESTLSRCCQAPCTYREGYEESLEGPYIALAQCTACGKASVL